MSPCLFGDVVGNPTTFLASSRRSSARKPHVMQRAIRPRLLHSLTSMDFLMAP